MLGLPPEYVAVIVKLILSLLTAVGTLAVTAGLRRLLRSRVQDPAQMRTIYMLARNAAFAVGTTVVVWIWLGPSGNFTVAMGILGAGIAFASQEVIGSFAGYLNIVTGGLYRIGDRVHIGAVTGDVVDISILRTTVMEIGEWVRADQYTGRIVSVANRVVFSDPVFNYTQHWPYLWDEIMVPITYESDWRGAGRVMLEQATEYTSHLQPQAAAGFGALAERYPLSSAGVDPALYSVMTDNWIEMTIRYVVPAQERREVQAGLHRELLQRFEEADDITVASVTMEIVRFPALGTGDAGVRPTANSDR
jgi:small-conductance mechanosensitive channel